MRIIYSLSIDDILALHDYRLQIDPQQRQRFWTRRFLYLFGFSVFALGGFWLTGRAAILYGFASLGILVFYLYPLSIRWQLRRTLEKTYSDEGARRGLLDRRLEISDRGLDQDTAGEPIHTAWDEIDDMGVVPNYAFISIGERRTWIILPRQGLVEGDFDLAVAEIRAYLQAPPDS
jgi:hypothetical protein